MWEYGAYILQTISLTIYIKYINDKYIFICIILICSTLINKMDKRKKCVNAIISYSWIINNLYIYILSNKLYFLVLPNLPENELILIESRFINLNTVIYNFINDGKLIDSLEYNLILHIECIYINI